MGDVVVGGIVEGGMTEGDTCDRANSVGGLAGVVRRGALMVPEYGVSKMVE